MKTRSSQANGTRDLRRRAQDRLRVGPTLPAPLPAKVDRVRVLQELQIHQIELELQNEELKQAKAEVDVVLEKYTDLYDFAPIGYFSLDRLGLILEVNLTGASMLGTERSHVTGRRFQLFVAPASRPVFQAFLGNLFAAPVKQVCEAAMLNASQEVFWADLEATPAASTESGSEWCRLAVIDVSARRQAVEAQRRVEILAATNRKLEEEIVRRQASEAALAKSELQTRRLLQEARRLQAKLRQLSHQVIMVQEKQRKQISRRLHDEISQLLLSINVHLELFTKLAIRRPEGIRRSILPLRRLVEESVQVIHRFARDLRPAMLDDLGLIPALRAYISDFPRPRSLKVEFTADPGVEILNNDKRTVLYRVAQESLANVVKHARARVVHVTLSKDRQGVSLEVSDNGRAFDPVLFLNSAWGERLGLIGMRERVEMVGGHFEITSAPGQGTTIRAQVPFAKGGWSRARRKGSA